MNRQETASFQTNLRKKMRRIPGNALWKNTITEEKFKGGLDTLVILTIKKEKET